MKKQMPYLSDEAAARRIQTWWSISVCRLRLKEPGRFSHARSFLFDHVYWLPEEFRPERFMDVVEWVVDTDIYFDVEFEDDDRLVEDVWSEKCIERDFRHRMKRSSSSGYACCDMCARFVSPEVRYSCEEGCDFDVCAACLAYKESTQLKHFV